MTSGPRNPSRDETAKAERLSKALRDNLKRRKAQARGREGKPEKKQVEDKPNLPAKR